MAAASTSIAVREGDKIADWEDYLEDDGDLRLVKWRNPKQESSTRAKLDPDLWSRLNDSWTEKIIAKLPFKALFRVASLSKTWSLAFRSPSFQREVLRSSPSSWASYSPLFVNAKQQLLGFDGKSQLWHRLPTRLEEKVPAGATEGIWRLECSGGSLLCWSSYSVGPGDYQQYIHVSNPLNGSFKQLPPWPETEDTSWPIIHVVCQRNDTYQVILISFDSNHEYERVDGRLKDGSICIRIFDSSSESWTITSHDNDGPEVEYGGSVILNGVIYMLVGRGCSIGKSLVSFHVRDRTWNVVAFVQEDFEHRYEQYHRLVDHQALDLQVNGVELDGAHFSQLVVCGSDIMLVTQYWVGAGDDESIALFKVDWEQGMAFRLATVPREMLIIGRVHCVVGYGECLCIFGRSPYSLAIRYNVKTHEWNWASDVPDFLNPTDVPDFLNPTVDFTSDLLWVHSNDQPGWIDSHYQPGWNPFLEV